jgi:hypothetical protein
MLKNVFTKMELKLKPGEETRFENRINPGNHQLDERQGE